MTRIDRLYMDNLSEFIFDDKKVVTFKFLSCTLGVHVNIAKQMLFHFHNANKVAKKRVYATYYVSGTVPQGSTTDPFYSEKNIDQNSQSAGYGYVVALCKEQDLDDFKKKFSKIHSVHIYALSAFPLENMDILRKAMKDPIYQERNPVDYGSISCKAALEVRENRRMDPPILSIEAMKSQSVKKVEEKSKSSSPVFFKSSIAEKQNTTNNSANKKSVSDGKRSTGQSDNRLKNMFATAASKPPKEKPKIEEEMDTDETSKVSNNDHNSPKQSSKTSRKGKKKEVPVVSKRNQNDVQSKKRKRIKDVLSSSSEENEKASEDEEYESVESPIPRKRPLIESDSEEDVVETPNPPVPEDAVERQPGRKRVSKTVSKTFMDKDGFLVTTKEQVMVSEPETSDTETTQVSKNGSSEANEENGSESKSVKEKKSEDKVPDKKNSKNLKTAPATTKSKQSTLMSFFQKK